MGFKPKDSEERTIPIPSTLVRDLKALKTTSKTNLIFPNGQGNANGHLLRDLKEVAKRGKLNCGHCESTHFGKAITCKTHAVCEQFYLHKFRHTFACMHLLAGVDVRTVQHNCWAFSICTENRVRWLLAETRYRHAIEAPCERTALP